MAARQAAATIMAATTTVRTISGVAAPFQECATTHWTREVEAKHSRFYLVFLCTNIMNCPDICFFDFLSLVFNYFFTLKIPRGGILRKIELGILKLEDLHGYIFTQLKFLI